MRILYFDLDGTILSSKDGEVKQELRNGALENAIRRAKIAHLVCVGNIGIVASAVEELGHNYDAIEIVFRLCNGAFKDINWFRDVTTMVSDPENRAEFINLSSDWWYMDDLAEIYLKKADLLETLMKTDHCRVYIPNPSGSGAGVLDWLNAISI
jgi:hypothetical protein